VFLLGHFNLSKSRQAHDDKGEEGDDRPDCKWHQPFKPRKRQDQRAAGKTQRERRRIGRHDASAIFIVAQLAGPGFRQYEQNFGRNSQQETQRKPEPETRHHWKQDQKQR